MSLPALEDITAHTGTTNPIEGLIRIETSPKEKATPIVMEMMRSVYPHDEVFGVLPWYDYRLSARRALRLHDRHCLEEWTYSLRGFTPTERRRAVAGPRPARRGPRWPGSAIRTITNREALTVDYHCAWDQGKHLWMIYLMRIVDAQVVFDKPGSVVLWTNCHHPFYDRKLPGNRAAEAAGLGR